MLSSRVSNADRFPPPISSRDDILVHVGSIVKGGEGFCARSTYDILWAETSANKWDFLWSYRYSLLIIDNHRWRGMLM